MPSGPCRLSAPIAPVRMLASPFSDWVITERHPLDADPTAVHGAGVTVAGR